MKVCLQPTSKENVASKKPFLTRAKDWKDSCPLEKAQAFKVLKLGLGPWIWPKIVTFVVVSQNWLKVSQSFSEKVKWTLHPHYATLF